MWEFDPVRPEKLHSDKWASPGAELTSAERNKSRLNEALAEGTFAWRNHEVYF